MQIIDFTDQIDATLPDVPVENLVRFNNSWLLLGEREQCADYLVAYRAMTYKRKGPAKLDGTFDWVFPEPPTFPGAHGTPWGEGWRGPVGDAEQEACVPKGRGGCYFDGVGLAEITVTTDADTPTGLSLIVTKNYILENTDGYEDPRLFYSDEQKRKISLHVHRKHPQKERGVYTYPSLVPSSAIFKTLNKAPFFLCVEVVQLHKEEEKYEKDLEYFYGLNIAEPIEKNFGFFFESGRLHAVYGVAPYGRPMSILQGKELLLSDDGKSATMPVSPCLPASFDGKQNLDCFSAIQDYYNQSMKCSVLRFSSSGPLIKRGKRWLGVGHVTVAYSLFNDALGIITGTYNVLLREEQIKPIAPELAIQKLLKNTLVLMSILSFLQNEVKTKTKIGNYQITKQLKAFFEGFPLLICQSRLFSMIAFIFDNYNEDILVSRMGTPTDKDSVKEDTVFFHPAAFYFSFLYEIEKKGGTWSIAQFSDAFICTDPSKPRLLQFPTNLAKCPGGYLLGIGENDHHSSVIHISDKEVEILLCNLAKNFQVSDFDFDFIYSGHNFTVDEEQSSSSSDDQDE